MEMEMKTYVIFLIQILASFLKESTSQGIWPNTILHSSTTLNNEKILIDGNVIYIGGSDNIKRIEYLEKKLISAKTINVPSPTTAQQNCELFNSATSSACKNHIRILDNYSEGKLVVCGTGSMTPRCVTVAKENAMEVEELPSLKSIDVSEATTQSVLSAYKNKTVAFVASAKVSKGSKLPEISRNGEDKLKSDGTWFKEPEMIKMIENNGKVFTFMIDKLNVLGSCNPGYNSFVARVCKNDGGGTFRKEVWTTHLKTQLQCYSSYDSGRVPLKFSEIKNIHVIKETVYGIFAVPNDWGESMIAVCAYTIDSINDVLDGVKDGGNTKFRKLPHTECDNPDAYSGSGGLVPGKCPTTPTKVDNEAFHTFLVEHPAVYDGVKPIHSKPLYRNSDSKDYKHLLALEKDQYTLVYMFTDDGYMLTLRVLNTGSDFETTKLNEAYIFEKGSDKKIISASLGTDNKGIVLVTSNDVILVDVSACSLHKSCDECLMDPQCYWQSPDNLNFFCSENQGDYSFNKCGNMPNPPSNLNAVYEENDSVSVTWKIPTKGCNNGCSTLIEIFEQKTSSSMHINMSNGENYNTKSIQMKPGEIYTVKASTMFKGLKSESAQFNLSREISPVILKYDKLQYAEWAPIPGASYYLVKFYETDGTVTFEGKLSASKHQMPFPLNNSKFNISVSAVSDHNIHSPEIFIQSSRLLEAQATTNNENNIPASPPEAETLPIKEETDSLESLRSENKALKIALGFVLVLLVLAIAIISQNLYAIGIYNSLTLTEISNNEDTKVCYERKWGVFWCKRENATGIETTSYINSVKI